MAIRRSLSAEVAQLVSHLTSGDETARESAGARLSIIGPRAGAALAALAGRTDAAPSARAAALAALGAVGDRRAAVVARELLRESHQTLVLAAIDVLRVTAHGRAREATSAFELLTEAALDGSRPAHVRVAAVRALKEHPAALVAPVLQALASDGEGDVVAEASSGEPLRTAVPAAAGGGAPPDAPSGLGAAIDETVAHEDIGAVSRAVGRLPTDAPVTALRRAVDAARERERAAPAQAARWRQIRADLHQALADRNSRLALYDLREMLEATSTTIPASALSAISAVGDVTCLESLARTWLTADETANTGLREQTTGAFQAIVTRERIGRRHPAIRKLLARWPAAAALAGLAPEPIRGRKRARLP